MFEIFSYWNFQSIISVLNAIVLVMGGGDFLGLLRSLAIVGMLVAIGVGLAKISAKEPLQYFMFLGLFYFTLFVPKVTVTVTDVRTAQTGTVANVPLGVAFFASTTSHVGKYLTDLFETAFVVSDELKFSHTGMAFGARAFVELAAVRVDDPRLNDAMTEFIRACVNPEILGDAPKYDALINSTDAWSLIGSMGWLNPGRTVNLPSLTGSGYVVTPCTDAYNTLNTALTGHADIQHTRLARILQPDVPPATARTLLAAHLPGIEAYMISGSRNITQQIMQGMSVNMLGDSVGSLAVARNDSGAMQVMLAAKMAESQATSAYRTMAMIGEAALPKFRNIIEIMIIAVFPIVLLLIILAGERGGAVLRTYAMTAIWVQLWAPLYAIVNLVLQPITAARFQAALDAAGPTILNNVAFGQTGFKESALAGALVMAVPVIAYALVRGGEVAMSGAMSALSAPASGGAQSAGAAVGVGNVSMGNTSWGTHSANSMSANKWDDYGSMRSGGVDTTRGDWSTRADLGAAGGGSGTGAVYGDGSRRNADLGPTGARMSAMVTQAAATAYTQQSTLASTAMQSYASSVGAAYEAYKGSGAHSGGSTSVNSGSSYGSGSTGSKSIDDATTAARSWSNGLRLSDADKFAWTAAAGGDSASGGKTKGGKDSASLSAFKAMARAAGNSGTESKLEAMYGRAQEAGRTQAFKDGMQTLQQAGTTTGTDAKSESGSRNEAGVRTNMSQAQQHLTQSQDAATKAEIASRAMTSGATNSGGVEQNLATQVQQMLGGAAAVERGSRPENQGAFALQVQNAVNSILSSGAGAALMNSNGATGADQGKMGEVEGNAGGRTAGGVPSAQAVRSQGQRWAGSVKGPETMPSLPGDGPGSPAVTQESVQTTTQGRLQSAQGRVAAGQANVETDIAGTQGKVASEQNNAHSPGSLVDRASNNAFNTIAGLLNGKGGVQGGTSVSAGQVPAPQPAPSGAESHIPTAPPAPLPNTQHRQSGVVTEETVSSPPPARPPAPPAKWR